MKVFLMLLLLPLGIFAQDGDSLSIKSKHILSLESILPVKGNKAAAIITPIAYIGYGFLTFDSDPLKKLDHYISDDLREDHAGSFTHIEDQLQFVPVASVYALGLVGVKGKNNFVDKSAMYFLSNALAGVSVKFIKKQTHKLRPDGSDHLSFPSGHTASAFVAAEFMSQEYKDVSPWYGIAAYGVATATGGLRIANNKHWFSDVVAGAGVGILSTKLTYLAYPLIKRKLFKNQTDLLIVPAYQPGFVSFSMRVPIR